MSLSKFTRSLICSENTWLKRFTFRASNRSEWVNEVNRGREVHGEYHHLFPILKKHESRFVQYMRMSTSTFHYILSKVEADLNKQKTNWRKPICAEERLVVTIRFLATGASFATLAFSFRMGTSTVREIVIETCETIWKNLVEDHMPKPTEEILTKSKQGFWKVWNFPNCVGALDGKHCRIKCPPHSVSEFYNYKKFFSIVLQAVSDPDYKFLVVEVGGKGKQADGGTFASSALFHCLENKTFNMPQDCNLPHSSDKAPHVLVGDEAYPLKTYLMRPYARKNLTAAKTTFNYRLSRARRCIECAFGILFAKWRILAKSIDTNVYNAITIIKCVCLLHNIIRERDGSRDPVYRDICILGRTNGPTRRNRRNNRYTSSAQKIRDSFTKYLNANRILKGDYSAF